MKVFQPKRLKRRNLKKFLFKPEFFQVSSFQPLRLKHLHCDDPHIIVNSVINFAMAGRTKESCGKKKCAGFAEFLREY